MPSLKRILRALGGRSTRSEPTRSVPPAAPAPAPAALPAPPPAAPAPAAFFHSHHYLRHNARRLEHLASLGLPVRGLSVLEVGAGIGDHSHYFIDRGCAVTITEARPENVLLLRERYPDQTVLALDLERPTAVPGAPFDVVHCYGLLYHLREPGPALAFLAQHCRQLLLLETCVSFGAGLETCPVPEDALNPTQAFSGAGCRPTRPWLMAELGSHFPHVYVPQTQPNHEEFPLDWSRPQDHAAPLKRAVFVCSREPLANPLLQTSLPVRQARHP